MRVIMAKCADIFTIRIHETVRWLYIIKCTCQQTKSPQIKSWRFFSLCYLLAIASNCTGTLPTQQRKSIQISSTCMCSYTHCVYNKVRVGVMYITLTVKTAIVTNVETIFNTPTATIVVLFGRSNICVKYIWISMRRCGNARHCDHGILQCKFECTKNESTQNSHNVLSRTFWVKTGVRENGWR